MSQYIDEDDEAGEKLPFEGTGGPWTPPAWHFSPEQLIEQARHLNNTAIAASLAMGGRTGGNPPAPPSWMRDT